MASADRHKKLAALLIGLKPMHGGMMHDEADKGEETPEEEHAEGEQAYEDIAGDMFDCIKRGNRDGYISAVNDLIQKIKDEDEEQDEQEEEAGPGEEEDER